MNITETGQSSRFDVICVSLQSLVQCQMAYSVIPAVAPQTLCVTPRHCVSDWRIHVLWPKVSVSMMKLS